MNNNILFHRIFQHSMCSRRQQNYNMLDILWLDALHWSQQILRHTLRQNDTSL